MNKKQLKDLKENECIEFKNKDERDKLCRLLHNNNYSLSNGVSYLDTSFLLHKYNHGVICVKQGLWDEIGAVSSNFKLYPLSDFIDDFVLPEKWCIKQNISQEVCDWFKKTLGVNALLEGGFEYLNNFELGLNGFFSNHIRENTTEITLEQFKKHILTQNKMEQNEKINISYKLLMTYYEASTLDQKKYLNDHFSLSGDTTISAIKGLYDIACDPWKAKIKANHPDIFKNDKVWKRNNNHSEKKDYYYLTRHYERGFKVDSDKNNIVNLNYRFETKKEAENEAFLYSTMMLMRSWVKHHNELDNFVADWTNDRQEKYIIVISKNDFRVGFNYEINSGIFQLKVSSKERAEELLKEFKQDIEKLIELKLI